MHWYMSLYVTYQRERNSLLSNFIIIINSILLMTKQRLTKLGAKYNSQINNPNHNNPNKYLTYKTHANNCLPNDCP